MAYRVTTRQAPGVADLDPTLYVLEDGKGAVAEVWPALGFNCIRWHACYARAGSDPGQGVELLYQDPNLFAGARPTRSGIPVLFPFPNRIRDGRFTWEGKEYALPTNDPAQKNAIHGFACRSPWRVVEQGNDDSSAWVTGVFRCSVDARASLAFWPADHEIRLTVRLGAGTLRLEALVTNPDSKVLPFGLGYHPYFRADEHTLIEVPAAEYWKLGDNLPTGVRHPVDASRNLLRQRPMSDLHLDDVLTALPARPARMDGLIERGSVSTKLTERMRLFCSPDFREMVVFTPPHRQAFCIEPYTCPTDAIHLTAAGQEVGWKSLAPGASWSGVVELWV